MLNNNFKQSNWATYVWLSIAHFNRGTVENHKNQPQNPCSHIQALHFPNIDFKC